MATSAVSIKPASMVYVRDHLGLGEAAVAWGMAAGGLGSMLAALTLPRVLARDRERPTMLAGATLAVVGLAGGALVMPGLPGLLGLWFVLGVGTSAIQTPAGRVIRRSSADEDRPAYFAAQFALSHAAWLIAYPVAGIVGGSFGLAAAFGVLGILAMLAEVVAAVAWPAHDPAELTHLHEVVEHDHPHLHDAHHDHLHDGARDEEAHSHAHRHEAVRHRHHFVIDAHHPEWGRGSASPRALRPSEHPDHRRNP